MTRNGLTRDAGLSLTPISGTFTLIGATLSYRQDRRSACSGIALLPPYLCGTIDLVAWGLWGNFSCASAPALHCLPSPSRERSAPLPRNIIRHQRRATRRTPRLRRPAMERRLTTAHPCRRPVAPRPDTVSPTNRNLMPVNSRPRLIHLRRRASPTVSPLMGLAVVFRRSQRRPASARRPMSAAVPVVLM